MTSDRRQAVQPVELHAPRVVAGSWFIGPATCACSSIDARRETMPEYSVSAEHHANEPDADAVVLGRGPSTRCSVKATNITPPAT